MKNILRLIGAFILLLLSPILGLTPGADKKRETNPKDRLIAGALFVLFVLVTVFWLNFF